MCEALRYTHKVLDRWVAEHPGSFPPIVLNLTDGESTDGDPAGPAQQLRSVGTENGPTLLFNLHISSDVATPTHYPSTDAGLPQMGAKLFSMSDVLPPTCATPPWTSVCGWNRARGASSSTPACAR
ncbi:hypothetical protein SHKM778_78180 [Streptomyces sp. KM77-8]|uniref:VWA domain-containing protein n=1 Tax=Streptomyces haneummycinicus TaxID=3074435 RepID=A0AAT9HWB9_9ACTN